VVTTVEGNLNLFEMKKLIINLGVIFILSFVFTISSCDKTTGIQMVPKLDNLSSKDGNSIKDDNAYFIERSDFSDEQMYEINENDYLSLEDIHNLAQDHNSNLNNFYLKLRTSHITICDEPINIGKFIKSALNENYYEYLNSENLQSAIKFSDDEVDKYVQRMGENFSSNLSPIQEIINKHKNYFTNTQIFFLEEIDTILRNNENDINRAILELNLIETKVQNQLPHDESQVILIGAEIGKASIQYWNENINNWVIAWEKGCTNGNVVTRWFSFGELVGADVAGAVGGAATAFVVNVIPGAGQVAYGGAIAGGAAGASAADAVSQIWNHFF